MTQNKNAIEVAFGAHIHRLQADIAERNGRLPHLTEVDCKNIASLRELRIPQYCDFIPGNTAGDMMEFSDLSKLVKA